MLQQTNANARPTRNPKNPKGERPTRNRTRDPNQPNPKTQLKDRNTFGMVATAVPRVLRVVCKKLDTCSQVSHNCFCKSPIQRQSRKSRSRCHQGSLYFKRVLIDLFSKRLTADAPLLEPLLLSFMSRSPDPRNRRFLCTPVWQDVLVPR